MPERQRLLAAGIPVVHAPEHAELARLLAETVERTAAVLASRWGLDLPPTAEVHVLTSWQRFVDDSVPDRDRVWVRLTRPLWRRRAERAFAVAGGWMLPWHGRLAVGVKPPDLLAASATAIGARLFDPVPDRLEKVRHVACHELTHAATAHLRLPPWLNEGVAMRTVDHLAGRPTVRDDTRELVVPDPSALDRRAYRNVGSGDDRALLALYATGYWTVRRLDERDAPVLREILSRRRPRREVRRMAREAFGEV